MNNDFSDDKNFNFSIINKANKICENSAIKAIILGFEIIIFLYLLWLANVINIKKSIKIVGVSNNTYLNSNSIYPIKENEIDDETFIQNNKLNLKIFCEKNNDFREPMIEINIKTSNAHLNNITFDMYIFKKGDFVSSMINKFGSWEPLETTNFISALNFYSKKKSIQKNNVLVLDIGANIGWFSFYLGKNGFNIMSFEPSRINYYILKKNYCLNDINITIINKALDIEEKNCTLYHPLDNIGNAILSCNQSILNSSLFMAEKIELTKLSKYIPYLLNKNLALIKLDIEGSEGKAIESGIDLINKHHIPFIFMEFTPRLLKLKGTDPRSFLELFENNGYKISKKGFLNQNYSTIDDILKHRQINIYFIYSRFLD